MPPQNKCFIILSCFMINIFLALAQSDIFNNESDYDFKESMEDFNEDQIIYEEDICSTEQFVNSLNFTDFLPEDYENMKIENITRNVQHINQTFAKFRRLQDWSQRLNGNKYLSATLNAIYSSVYDVIYELDLQPECLSALIRIATGVQKRNIWALKFIDSMGDLIPSGILEGVVSSFGEYDECLDIASPPEDESPIYGQYCLLNVALPYPKVENYRTNDEKITSFKFLAEFLQENDFDKYVEINPLLKFIELMTLTNGTLFRLGICIPDKCDAKDVENAINKFLYPILGLPMEIDKNFCNVKRKNLEIDSFQMFSIVFFLTMISLVFLSTTYEIYIRNFRSDKKNLVNGLKDEVLLSFSIISNTNKLIETKNRFASIDTLKLLLSLKVLAFHVFLYTPQSRALKRYTNSIPSHILYYDRYFFARTPGLSVEPFMLSMQVGLMLAYSTIGKLEKSNGKFNYIFYCFKRWLRLSVSLFGSILIIYLLPLTGSGPIWHKCYTLIQPECRKFTSLMSSFLYYSNWNEALSNYPLNHLEFIRICNLGTWFLSASFQLYLIAPFIFLPLFKWPKFGITLNLTILLLSVVLNVSPKIFLNNLSYYQITRITSLRELLISYVNYQLNTFQYVCTFSMGILTGYILRKHPNIYIGGPIVEGILNIISIAIIPLMYMWNNSFWILNDSASEISVLLYFAFAKFFWGLSFAWIWFACSTGRAEFLNRVLSLRCVQPIAKLHYLIYLVHFPVIFHRMYTVKQTYIMTDYSTFQNIFVDFVITILLSYLLYLLLECPAINLTKIWESANFFDKNNETHHQIVDSAKTENIYKNLDTLKFNTIIVHENNVTKL